MLAQTKVSAAGLLQVNATYVGPVPAPAPAPAPALVLPAPANLPVTYKLFDEDKTPTRTICYPLVSERLKVLAWRSSYNIFWEGFSLLFVSIVTSSLAFCVL